MDMQPPDEEPLIFATSQGLRHRVRVRLEDVNREVRANHLESPPFSSMEMSGRSIMLKGQLVASSGLEDDTRSHGPLSLFHGDTEEESENGEDTEGEDTEGETDYMD